MSVKLRFESPAEGEGVRRSRSFAGFGTPLSRHARVSSVRSSVRSRGFSGKSPRMPHSSRSPVASQPEQVERVFQTLRRGLKEYLEGHQAELDFLTAQQRDSKRISRLAFLYDLEKEIRALERYIRRLEFHISKVEELHEAYAIQWRLCTGAANMKRAFALSPSTRASRESLLQLGRSQRQCLEDMFMMEGELELLLGELHIKMKGLIGFARLCPGDQYEVLIRLGRQRWKLKGKIEADDRQSWDEEEMVFLPHIQENFEIKVTEVKGLGSVLVGVVTCESLDFFQARPHIMVVDITELGTIKLQMEVMWDPFDSGETRPMSTSTSKLSVPSRKGSLYSWTPPSTPSFTEKYFISVARRLQDPENSFALSSQESRGVSLLSYLTDTSQGSQSPVLGGDEPQAAEDGAPVAPGVPQEQAEDTPLPAGSPLPQHRYGTPDILKQNGDLPPVRDLAKGGSLDSDPPAGLDAPRRTPAEDRRQRRRLALRIGQLLLELDAAVKSQGRGERELQRLESLILHLGDILKNDLYLHKTSSTETLAVEEVLGSFDFLCTDFSADELSCLGSLRQGDTGISTFRESTLRSLGLLHQDTASTSKPEVTPFTTGNFGLDQALEIHLSICSELLKQMKQSDSALVQAEILEELSLQVNVLEKVSKLSLGKNAELYSAKDIVPKSQRLKGLLAFWDECSETTSVFCCPAETFLKTLRKRFIHRLKAKQPGQVDTVFAQLLQLVLSSCRLVPAPPRCPDQVTVFQFFGYLSRCGLTDFGEHLSHLASEVTLIGALESPGRRRALDKLRGKRIAELQPLGRTLQLLAALQVDANSRVAKAATSCLSKASASKSFRAKAVVFYTEALKDPSPRCQQVACLALKCLKAAESVDLIADLWRSADEDVRHAAREAVLSFGKKGHLAFQRMDKICLELQEDAFQNADTEITIL
ncbi:RIPOR family member 3 isoform X1 [Lepisosteus oculatus]|uniref:RIPOR family member 3 isoform X1 n=2 Tax=Lepisosteus oculatus TaxID=7918 RepID=UPI0035F50B85